MLKQWLKKTKNKYQLSAAAVLVAALALYLSGVGLYAGWLTYGVQFPALLILVTTALSRVNDIRPERTEWIWQIRRVGLSFVGVAATALIFSPFSGGGFPTWRGLMLTWGMAMTWLATPGMPPWSKYTFGSAKLPKSMT